MNPVIKLPFLLHTVVETIAAFTFIFYPQRQISCPSDDMRLVLQCYGGCLLFTSLASLTLLCQPEVDRTFGMMALAFAFWHLWPTYRAASRMVRGKEKCQVETEKTLGGPPAHFAIHALLFMLFVVSGVKVLGNSPGRGLDSDL
jgi:hypothetical protein